MYLIRFIFYSLFFCSVVLFLSSCGISGGITERGGGKSRPIEKEIETGVASWYGPNFHGKLTANGEVYDMHGITAAHRTLPFNTVVKVENLDNGKSVIVRINDRGPFAKNRIIDLSRAAAEEIDMIGSGTANVRLYLLEGDIRNLRTNDLAQATYTIQLGSFQSYEWAQKRAGEIEGSRVEEVVLNGNTIYRVYYGEYTSVEQAEKDHTKLRRQGYTGYVKQLQN